MDFHSCLLYVYWTYWRAPTKICPTFWSYNVSPPSHKLVPKNKSTKQTKKLWTLDQSFAMSSVDISLKSSLGKVTKKWLKDVESVKPAENAGEIWWNHMPLVSQVVQISVQMTKTTQELRVRTMRMRHFHICSIFGRAFNEGNTPSPAHQSKPTLFQEMLPCWLTPLEMSQKSRNSYKCLSISCSLNSQMQYVDNQPKSPLIILNLFDEISREKTSISSSS